MFGRRSMHVRSALSAFSLTCLLFAATVSAQIEPPPIPNHGQQPPVSPYGVCLTSSVQNPNYDAWDPCLNPPLAGRPDYCPASAGNPLDPFESGIENYFRNFIVNQGLDDLLNGLPLIDVNDVAGYLAGQVISAAGSALVGFLNGDSGNADAAALTVGLFNDRLSWAGDRLTSLMLTTVAAISTDPLYELQTSESYCLPFVASPAIKNECQDLGGVHQDRGFDLGVMNGTASNGLYTFTAQAGVPTEIKANRPSSISRFFYDYRWMWWFGDAVMVPQSANEDAYTVHTYPLLGDYDLSFVMLRDDLEIWFLNFSVGDNGFKLKAPRISNSEAMFPDACNYGTMQVVENQRPYAQFSVGPTNIAYQLRFTAAPSFDPDGNPLAYLWVLEDGGTTRARTFTKMYPPGQSTVVETVQLTVSDGAKMHTTTRTIYATPSNCVPVGPLDPIAGGLCGDDSRDGPGLPFP
ncbi:MAG: PKD domain-containing protein [Gammaproteobacteria bacterium]|nr:PKD domain-containing protein [Gammaproteobacteria bacterium]